MKIVLVTYGSRGDVQPMLALSLALQNAGYEVLLIGPPEKEAWVRQFRCPYASLGADVTAAIDEMGCVTSLGAAIQFVTLIRKQMAVQFDALPHLISGADLVLGASLTFGLPSVAETLNIPYRYILFTPQLFPSGYHPCALFKIQRFPGWINKTGWHLVRILDRFNLTEHLNQLRKRSGLKPVDDLLPHLLGKEVIVASDRELFPIPEDVSVRYCQTGYFHLDSSTCEYHEENRDAIEKKLDRFIKRGGPIVYVGFGSMPRKDQVRIMPEVVSALRSIEVRAVFGMCWDEGGEGGEGESIDEVGNNDRTMESSDQIMGSEDHLIGRDDPMGGDILTIEQYPHLDLFPRMDAVVHHGGAGTTATALASGIPQVIVPHILDQYYHGHRIYKADLGPLPIWREHLTAQKLSRALTTALKSRHIKEKARCMGEQIDIHNGLKKAVDYIESIL